MNARNGKWQDLVDKCMQAYEDISNSKYRKQKINNIAEARRTYELLEKKVDFPWKDAYNTILPLLTIGVDNLEPRLVSSLVGREPYVQFNMRGVSTPDEMAAFLEEWFNAELKEVVKLKGISARISHDLLLEGTVYPVATYNEDKVVRTDFKYVNTEQGEKIELDPQTGEVVTEDIEDTVFEGGVVNYVSFEDIYVPDDVEDWEKTDIIRKIRPTYADLQLWQREQSGYRNIGTWLLTEEEEQTEGSSSQENVEVEFTGREIVECLEYHVNYIYQKENQKKEDITNWVSERWIALIAVQSETLIRLIKLRDINYQGEHVIKRIRIYPEGGRSYGCSLYDKMKSVQNGASDTFNLLMNTAYICIIPWFIYGNKAGLPNDIEISPGIGIPVDDPKDVVFPKFGVDINSFMPILNTWISFWEKLGSIGDLQIGKPSAKAETATETMAVIQEGNIKHNYQAKVMKEEFLSLIKTLYDLYYKNMSFSKTFFYQNKERIIQRSAMKRAYDFRLTGSTDISNKIMELRKTEQLYKTLRGDSLTNPLELVKDMIRGFKPDADPEKYINPEINQLIEQYLKQKEMEAQQQEQVPRQ